MRDGQRVICAHNGLPVMHRSQQQGALALHSLLPSLQLIQLVLSKQRLRHYVCLALLVSWVWRLLTASLLVNLIDLLCGLDEATIHQHGKVGLANLEHQELYNWYHSSKHCTHVQVFCKYVEVLTPFFCPLDFCCHWFFPWVFSPQILS